MSDRSSRLACLAALALLGVCGPARALGLAVELDGVEGELRDNVLAHLGIYRYREAEGLTQARIEALHRRARAEIRAGLEALGRYAPSIEADLECTDAGCLARYRVDPGPPVTVTEVDVRVLGEGAADPAFAALAGELPLGPGEVLNHGRYERAKRALERLATERGYFDARFERAEIRVDRAARTAAVHLHYATGRRYRFGEVRLPDTVLGGELLGRYVPFAAGDPYSAAELLDLQAALIDSDYFAAVEVEPRLEEAGDGAEVPIAVALEPRKPQRYSLGLGFGTDTGPRVRAGWERRYLNERGHRLGVEARLSAVVSSLTGRYEVPLTDPRNERLQLTTGLLAERTDSADSLKGQLGAARIGIRGGWREVLSLEYLGEYFDVGDESEVSGQLVPGARWSRTWADDPVYPEHGLRLSAGLSGAHDALLSDLSFLQVRAQAKYIRALGGRWRAILRGELGATVTSDFDALPATLRFFAGGDTSLRGFDFRALGPRDGTGKVIGGRYLALGSLELERRIRGPWGVAVFSDFGNAFNDLSDPMAYSVGAGLRWLSPVGLVRVALAAGVSDDDLPVRLHVVIGPDL